MRSFRNMNLGAAVVCVLVSGCAIQELGAPTAVSKGVVNDDARAATGIVLNKSLHFMTPDGNDIVVQPGRYQVEPTVDAQLRLVPEGGSPLSLAASRSNNEIHVTVPTALSVSSDGDDHIVLLLPGGTALDAVGSTSDVGTRGPKFLPKGAIGNALNTKALYKSSAIQDRVQQTKKTGPALAVQFHVQPAQQVSGYQACDAIAGFGYVSSLKTQQTRHTPPGMGTPSPVTTQPRSGYLRALAKNNPNRCAIGSVTVTPTRGTVHAGDHVQLLVAGFVFTPGYPYMGGYWVEDTYDLTASGNGPLTFTKVVMAATFVGDNPQNFQQAIQRTVRESPKGSPVAGEAMVLGISAGSIPCVYTPIPEGYGAGTMSCAPGLLYPPTGR